jgi:cytochrome c-type biogenesis protein CcmH/NrfG
MNAPMLDMLSALDDTDQPQMDELTGRLERRIEENPASLRSWLLLGNCYYLQGKIALAIETFQKAIALDPEVPYAYYFIGVALYRGARIQEAIEALTKVTTLSPSMVMAYYWLGIAHFHAGQYPQARQAFEVLLQRNKESHIAHYHAALICLAEREYDAARCHLEVLTSLGSNDPQVYLHLGEAYFHLNKTSQAADTYREGLKLNPGNVPLQESLAELVDVQEP